MTARLGTAPLATTLTFEVAGIASPAFQAVRKVSAVAPAPVRFTTTAAASAGTPLRPPTVRLHDSPAANAPWWPPSEPRVSRMRTGLSGTNPASTLTTGGGGGVGTTPPGGERKTSNCSKLAPSTVLAPPPIQRSSTVA